jgi:hypothetical protein
LVLVRNDTDVLKLSAGPTAAEALRIEGQGTLNAQDHVGEDE